VTEVSPEPFPLTVVGMTTVRGADIEAAFAEACGAPASWGGDGAALMSDAVCMASWEAFVTVGNEEPMRCAPTPPRAVADEVLPDGHTGLDQAARRQEERQWRKQVVAFARWARAAGWSNAEVAEVIGLSPRTLRSWKQAWERDHLQSRPRGRPPRLASAERAAAVHDFLEHHGPHLSLATLRAEYRDITRTVLAALRAAYRDAWRAAHTHERCELDWLCPGSVWAIDFSHPPHLVDGVFRAILNVRDLASHQQLLWLAVSDETARTVMEALGDLFAHHGAPLVLKCDNGPAFVARATKDFLHSREVFALYSPPYCARYNGACERANRTLKELTEHVAERSGRAGFWKSDDLHEARRRANGLSRPWGAAGATPEETWTTRGRLSLDKRTIMWQYLKSGIALLRSERDIDPAAALPHYTQTEIERLAAQPVLESLGLLHVTRRRIAPVI
jgi:transposase